MKPRELTKKEINKLQKQFPKIPRRKQILETICYFILMLFYLIALLVGLLLLYMMIKGKLILH